MTMQQQQYNPALHEYTRQCIICHKPFIAHGRGKICTLGDCKRIYNTLWATNKRRKLIARTVEQWHKV